MPFFAGERWCKTFLLTDLRELVRGGNCARRDVPVLAILRQVLRDRSQHQGAIDNVDVLPDVQTATVRLL
jgi:hypothetical protein